MYSPFGTGAIARKKDIRDYRIGLAQGSVSIPAVFKPSYSGLPVKMQGKYGTCGGHAGSAFVSFMYSHDLSPKFLWREIVSIHPYGINGGTDMTSIFKALYASGDCHESICPNTLDSSIGEYSDTSKTTGDMRDDAAPFGTDYYAFTNNPNFSQIKQAIYQNKVVIARVNCGSGWYTDVNGNGSWLEKDVCPLRLGNFDSGHFIVLWGYDENFIYFRNSWSAAWGMGGDGYFDASYLPNVLEIGVALPSISKRQKLVNYLTALLHTLQTLYAALTSQKTTNPQ